MFFAFGDFVVLCLNSKLKIYSLRSGPQPVIIEIPKIEMKNERKNQSEETDDYNVLVICGGFSRSGNLLAVCDNNKRLIVWQLDECRTNWQLKQEFKVARKCVKLVFTADEKHILVGDRSGDVYIYDLSCTGNTEGALLMGHLSMLLDFDLTADEKYLVTSDRDEKIRVSCFPNSYNIHSYCLGHSEFVSSFCFIGGDFLLSGSGDATIRIWNYLTGDEISFYDCCVDVKQSGQRTAVKQVLKLCDNLIAVLFYGLGDVLLYKINCNDNSCVISLFKRINASRNPIHKIVHCNNFTILITVNKDEMFMAYDINCGSLELTKNCEITGWINSINSETEFIDQFYRDLEIEEKSLEGLYKTWFNNVETYLEKKKEREDAKRLKSKKSK